MGCQSRDYTISDGFLPIYYLGESIKSSICDIHSNFKSLVGGRKKRRTIKSRTIKRVSNKKSRKYKQYINGKGNKSRKKYIV